MLQVDLPPERAAQIVRQSSNARWVSFLAVVIVVLFVALYWFYELGGPLGLTQSRLEAEADAQQVTRVERGYNIFQANCARCHGDNGEGGIGPVLNSQEKLYQHLNADYLNTVLVAGGRYVCGNPLSQMPVWSDTATPPGPLNYTQIEDVIEFIRAENTQTFTIRDPELFEPETDPITGEVKTFTGWVDPTYEPAPGRHAVPGVLPGRASPAVPSPDRPVRRGRPRRLARPDRPRRPMGPPARHRPDRRHRHAEPDRAGRRVRERASPRRP